MKLLRSYDLLPQVKSLLSVQEMDDLLWGSGRVFVADGHSLPDDGISDSYWARIVLMYRTGVLENQLYQLDGVLYTAFNLRVDLMPPSAPNFDSQRTLETIHQKAFDLIHQKNLALADATMSFPLWLHAFPTRMFREEEKGFRFMTSIYKTVLKP